MDDTDPLIVSAVLEPGAAEAFDALRRRHFPPALNRLAAHLTLFHALPGREHVEVARALRAEAREAGVVGARAVGLRSLGRGCAIEVEAPALGRVRAALARRFEPWLTPQDRQGFRPHVTIQNKVDPAHARATLERLRAGFAPRDFAVVGLALWRYRGGPWEARGTFPFVAATPDAAFLEA